MNMIKPFTELYKTDISGYISKKPTFKWNKDKQQMEQSSIELDYLNWADCLLLLYENGAESVAFGNVYNVDGHPVFINDGKLPYLRVFVEIDGTRRELSYPLIDGSKDISVDKMAQSDVHNASQRAFVKCVAVNWGLGLSLWQKEERELPPTPPKVEDGFDLHQRITRKANAAVKKLGSLVLLSDVLGMSDRDIKKVIGYASNLADLENALDGILNDNQ